MKFQKSSPLSNYVDSSRMSILSDAIQQSDEMQQQDLPAWMCDPLYLVRQFTKKNTHLEYSFHYQKNHSSFSPSSSKSSSSPSPSSLISSPLLSSLSNSRDPKQEMKHPKIENNFDQDKPQNDQWKDSSILDNVSVPSTVTDLMQPKKQRNSLDSHPEMSHSHDPHRHRHHHYYYYYDYHSYHSYKSPPIQKNGANCRARNKLYTRQRRHPLSWMLNRKKKSTKKPPKKLQEILSSVEINQNTITKERDHNKFEADHQKGKKDYLYCFSREQYPIEEQKEKSFHKEKQLTQNDATHEIHENQEIAEKDNRSQRDKVNYKNKMSIDFLIE